MTAPLTPARSAPLLPLALLLALCALLSATPARAQSGAVRWQMGDPGIGHVVGRADAGGWSASTGQDPAGFLQYGPYATRVPPGPRAATWTLLVDNTTYAGDPGPLVQLQAYDHTTDTLLAARDVRRAEFAAPFRYQDFALPFTLPAAAAGDQVELRLFWDSYSYVREQSVAVSAYAWGAQDPALGHQVGSAAADGGWQVFYDQGAGFLQYGPYTAQLVPGAHVASWDLLVDNNTATGDPGPILRLDINDVDAPAGASPTLASRDLSRSQWTAANQYQTFTLPFTLPASAAGHRIEMRAFFNGYSYVRERSVAVDAGGTDQGSSTPAAPSGLAAAAGDGQVSLSWSAVTGATGYNVYRGTMSGGEAAAPVATGLTNPAYADTGLADGTTYYYVVTTTGPGGESGRSNEAGATPTAPVNAAAFVSQNVPATMTSGQSYPVTVTMRNTGTTTWTDAGNYHLGSQSPQDNTTWTGSNRITLPGPIAPGQTATFSFTVTAPSTPNAYPFQWRMVQEFVQWFGDFTPNVSVAVSPALTSLTLSPTTIAGGQAVMGTATLTGPAPSGGLTVSLSSDNAAATVPGSVTVSTGSTSATFTVATSAVPATTTAHIAAAYNGVTKTAALTINPASGSGTGGVGGFSGGSGNAPVSAFVPLPSPDTNPATDGGDPTDYDWTGLVLRIFSAGTDYGPAPLYLGPNGRDYDEEYVDYTLHAKTRITVSGTSTYKWLWTPPVNPIGLKNDPTKSASDPGQPFPLYPTYMLEGDLPYVAADEEPRNPASATAAGNVKDGFDPAWNPMFNQVGMFEDAPANSVDVNNAYTGQLPRHFIKPAAVENDSGRADIVDALLSPYLDVYAQGDGLNGYVYGDVSEFGAPIQMAYPNVLARPDLGDGQNQFVYSNAPFTNTDLNPAILSVPAGIQALGANQEQINWLLSPTKGGPNPKNQDQPLVDWNFDEYSVAANSLAVANTKIPYTRERITAGSENAIVPNTTDALGYYNIDFHGLPETPAEYLQRLGNHTVTLNVSTYTPGQPVAAYDSAVAYFQAFFNGLATNYPYGQGDANWWHYYTMMDPFNFWTPFQDPTEVPSPVLATDTKIPYVQYYPGGGSSRAYDPSYQVEIHDDAYTYPEMRVFDIDPHPVSFYSAGTFQGDANGNTLPGDFHVVRYVGYLELQGIYSYIAATAHELGHIISFNKPYSIPHINGGGPWMSAAYIVQGQGADGPDRDPNAPFTNGYDDLWKEWKYEHHLNPYWSQTVSDDAYGQADQVTGRLTTGEVGISDPNVPTRKDAPDNEILADLPAVAALFENDGRSHNFDAWKLDWADQGINRAKKSDGTYGAAPYFGMNQIDGSPPIGQLPQFYLRFVPAVDGYPANGQPWKPGVGKLPDQSYGVRSLADLKAQYPNLVTSIDDLGLPDSNFFYYP